MHVKLSVSVFFCTSTLLIGCKEGQLARKNSAAIDRLYLGSMKEVDLTYLTWLERWSLVTAGGAQATALSCSAVSIFLQLYLKPAVFISFSRSLFHVFFGCPLFLWLCSVHCSACLTMQSLFLLSLCPSQFHFLLLSWISPPERMCTVNRLTQLIN